jgi:hypothetical protein
MGIKTALDKTVFVTGCIDITDKAFELVHKK